MILNTDQIKQILALEGDDNARYHFCRFSITRELCRPAVGSFTDVCEVPGCKNFC